MHEKSVQPLNEIQRQAYLKAMGIESYFPRLVLPGAPESRQCDWPEEYPRQSPEHNSQTKISVTADATPRAEGKEKTAQGVPEPMGGQPLEKPAAKAPTARESGQTVQESGQTVQEIRFQLAFIRVDDQLCVLNQLPHVGRNQLSPGHRQLLHNLLRSRGISVSAGDIEGEIYRWPYMEGLVDKGADAARQGLHSYLQQKLSDRPFSTLLVMGALIVPYLYAQEQAGYPEHGVLDKGPARTWRILTTKSLDELLRFPALKREVWEHLRPLSRQGDV